MYPYHDEFISFSTNVEKLSNDSIQMLDSAIKKFWNFYSPKKEVTIYPADIDNQLILIYIDYLLDNQGFKKTTVNKHLVYLKKYFDYLYDLGLVKEYPFKGINAFKLSSRKTYIINWMYHLSDFVTAKCNPMTIKVVASVAFGFQLTDFCTLRWSDIESNLNDSKLREYFVNSFNFEKTPNPYIFSKDGSLPTFSKKHICFELRKDKTFFSVASNYYSIYLSYVYSNILDPCLTDEGKAYILQMPIAKIHYYEERVQKLDIHVYKPSLLFAKDIAKKILQVRKKGSASVFKLALPFIL